MARRYDWTLQAAFSVIDLDKIGFIEFKSIMSFLCNTGYHASEGEVIAIIRRLDIDADQRVSFEEFRNSLELSQPYLI